MQFFYGDKMFYRILDEAEFWKLQESEHTIVIRKIVPNLESEYVNQLQNWEQVLVRTHAVAIRYLEAVNRAGLYISPQLQQQIVQFVNFCMKQSREFINLLNLISSQSSAVQDNPVASTVIDHIRRESEYFIGITKVAMERATYSTV
ncbi:MAG TPA: DUF2935 domain-containing protein [Clostridiaceae bacterium]|nr:DUF2935 domain-containing protein [Clostridiaceae bacterium]